jgi:hypothetical protein
MKYKATFSNSKGTVETEISEESFLKTSEYFCPMIINGVTIETDGFDSLSIDNPEQYSENQLTQFEYDITYPYKDKEKKLLVLKNYQLKAFIPIHVREIKSGERIETEMQITMQHNGGKNIKRTCSLLGETSEQVDMEVALGEVQAQLAECYCMEICTKYKNSWWNPYGGNEFFNQLCFVSETEAFQAIKDKHKSSVADFMKYKKYDNYDNFQRVLLTDYCDKFEPRHNKGTNA